MMMMMMVTMQRCELQENVKRRKEQQKKKKSAIFFVCATMSLAPLLIRLGGVVHREHVVIGVNHRHQINTINID
jgi:hypothetical protein